MKRIIYILFILFCLIPINAMAQKLVVESPNMDEIQREISDPKSQFYYPKLMDMYRSNDTIMTHEQYRRLYLGAVFQEDYNPYRVSEYSNKLKLEYEKTHHSTDECNRIIKYADLALQDDPFDMRQMIYMIYALKERRKNARAAIWQYRLSHLLDAILSTGSGKSDDNAWVVTNVAHEYVLLNSIGYVAEKQEFMPPTTDYIQVKELPKEKYVAKPSTDGENKGFYFNVSYIIKAYDTKYQSDENKQE